MENALSNTPKLSQEPLLPRSAWTNQLAYLRALFRAKKALDLAGKEANREQT